jgi:hypothetical protein
VEKLWGLDLGPLSIQAEAVGTGIDPQAVSGERCRDLGGDGETSGPEKLPRRGLDILRAWELRLAGVLQKPEAGLLGL